MLGSVSEAEDVVQESLLRVHRALERGDQIESPRAFVTTVASRLAINELRSARARRERYVGEWLPEPIITDGEDDPARHAETADSLSVAMLVLLESLSPEQRAVLLLHDVFDYPFEFRVDRRPNPHLTFGFGEHFCMGAHLARVEIEAMFTHLVDGVESFEISGPIERLSSITNGSIKRLPIRLSRTS